jgi:hypothetical protein
VRQGDYGVGVSDLSARRASNSSTPTCRCCLPAGMKERHVSHPGNCGRTAIPPESSPRPVAAGRRRSARGARGGSFRFAPLDRLTGVLSAGFLRRNRRLPHLDFHHFCGKRPGGVAGSRWQGLRDLMRHDDQLSDILPGFTGRERWVVSAQHTLFRRLSEEQRTRGRADRVCDVRRLC